MFPKTLYKFKNDKWQTWTVDVQGNTPSTFYDPKTPYDIVVSYGYEGGAIQETRTTISVGKNIGKSNETTPYEQACSEAESKWKKQQDKGYVRTKTFVDKSVLGMHLPMLAKSFDKDGSKIQFPCYGQPKFDGCRCLTREYFGIDIYSRKGKSFKALPHIIKALGQLPSYEFDGELYSHDLTFQEIISRIKRDEEHPDNAKIEYHIYDIIDTTKTYEERLGILKSLNLSSPLKAVETFEVNSIEEIWTFHKEYTKLGYEGIMLRNKHGLYEIDRRSQHLQKVKTFLEQEFKIVGAERNKGRMSEQCTLLCVTDGGKEFGAKIEGDSAYREQVWVDAQAGKLLDKMLTVRFFEWTDEMKPRFPTGVAIRDYE
jgi:DNA ligase-1